MVSPLTQTAPSNRLLVVDDEENVRASLKAVLEDEGYTVETVGCGADCVRLLERRNFDLIFLDVWLPGKDGLEVLKEIRSRRPTQYVIMISGHGTIETAVQATKLGAFDFVEKPLSLEKILLVLEHALKQKRLEEENRSLKDLVRQETAMIGESVPMIALRQQIQYAAPTEGRILIFGENGTGKELVARLIHLGSPRRDQPFVEVNCAAIPEDLIESELFGSEKGAYTGSTETRKGKFELGDGGTVFLDEVGDMSVKTQAKVLRVLEEQRFVRLGGSQPIEIDVRVIAATNKNLEEEIEKGNFREDLFFRLNVIPFEVPPLRERKEDIPLLVDYFMDHFCDRYGKPKKSISKQAMQTLHFYYWPGNVRELKNIVERLVIMVPNQKVEASDLPTTLRKPNIRDFRPAPQRWQEAREDFERKFILEKLREYDGNISRTAAAIGMERTHLHRKLKAYKIQTK
ncbi:MAG: sigma-54-dependent Fis family transcriptional regulator [Acidobacteria bacterium]|nr:MAG: sigma-54-dependent Fis family transcriptional regulator [Acidobacteriota bacterium]